MPLDNSKELGQVQSGYLDTLMGGIKAGQERRAALKARQSALQKQAASSLAGQGGGMGSIPIAGGGGGPISGGDFGNPRDRNNYTKNYLTSVRLPNGQSVLIHKNIAQNFGAMMSELWNSGYKFGDVQTYNYRNVNSPKGSGGLLSRHSTGLAWDIDPGKNAWGAKNIALPKNYGQLLGKYGFSWLGPKNGDWMHGSYTGAQWKGVSPN